MQKRKLNHLSGHDYSQGGAYFITLFVHDHENVFGRIFNGEMILNEYGKIVEMQWQFLFEEHKYLEIDEYIIMPNHFHGILRIVGNGQDHIKPLPQLIGAFKTAASKLIHQTGNSDFQWQKSSLDRIIRNDEELNHLREYIYYNPMNAEGE